MQFCEFSHILSTLTIDSIEYFRKKLKLALTHFSCFHRNFYAYNTQIPLVIVFTLDWYSWRHFALGIPFRLVTHSLKCLQYSQLIFLFFKYYSFFLFYSIHSQVVTHHKTEWRKNQLDQFNLSQSNITHTLHKTKRNETLWSAAPYTHNIFYI